MNLYKNNFCARILSNINFYHKIVYELSFRLISLIETMLLFASSISFKSYSILFNSKKEERWNFLLVQSHRDNELSSSIEDQDFVNLLEHQLLVNWFQNKLNRCDNTEWRIYAIFYDVFLSVMNSGKVTVSVTVMCMHDQWPPNEQKLWFSHKNLSFKSIRSVLISSYVFSHSHS